MLTDTKLNVTIVSSASRPKNHSLEVSRLAESKKPGIPTITFACMVSSIIGYLIGALTTLWLMNKVIDILEATSVPCHQPTIGVKYTTEWYGPMHDEQGGYFAELKRLDTGDYGTYRLSVEPPPAFVFAADGDPIPLPGDGQMVDQESAESGAPESSPESATETAESG